MARSLNRREFLRLASLTAGIALLPPLLRKETTVSPESAEPLARGYYCDWSGKIYGAPMEILGGDAYFQYTVRNASGVWRAPIENIQITEGYPFSDVVTNLAIGVRLDDPNLMANVPRMGAGTVRVDGDIEDLGGNSVFESAIYAAEAQKVQPLIVFNPTWPRKDDYIRDKIGSILARHPGAAIELGNEPDNTVVSFWAGQDLVSFTHFVMTALGVIWERSWRNGGTTPVVLAGLTWITNQRRYLETLRDGGVNFDNPFLRFGFHSYQSVEDTRYKLEVIDASFRNTGLTKPPLWLTEVGVTYPGRPKWIALDMVSTALQYGTERAYVHTLVDGVEGFELMSNDGSSHLPIYYGFESMARRLSGNIVGPIVPIQPGPAPVPTKPRPHPIHHRGEEE